MGQGHSDSGKACGEWGPGHSWYRGILIVQPANATISHACNHPDRASHRYMYGETLGRWRAPDLLVGLAYLARKDGEVHVAEDIAKQGRLYGEGLNAEQRAAALQEIDVIQRFMRYCSCLRERRGAQQRDLFKSLLGIGAISS